MPPNSNFRPTPRSSISTKIRLYGYGAKSPTSHCATVPPNSNFRLPRGLRFRPKFDFTVMAPNHLGSILGPMGSHWVQKMGHHRKKLRYPQIRIFDYPAVIDFDQNSTLRYHLGSTLWPKFDGTTTPRPLSTWTNRVPLGPKMGHLG